MVIFQSNCDRPEGIPKSPVETRGKIMGHPHDFSGGFLDGKIIEHNGIFFSTPCLKPEGMQSIPGNLVYLSMIPIHKHQQWGLYNQTKLGSIISGLYTMTSPVLFPLSIDR